MEFRFEMFNAFNRAHFDTPNNVTGSPGFLARDEYESPDSEPGSSVRVEVHVLGEIDRSHT